MKIHLHTVEDAGIPIKKGFNEYSCFNCVKNKKGIYIFQHRDTGEVLYVGEAGASGGTQRLAKRIKQHYGWGKTGANFSINWRKENCQKCKDDVKCESNGKCNYAEYEKVLSESRIIFLCCENARSNEIYALEKLIKFIFLPKFDREVMKMRECEIDVANFRNIIRCIAQNELEPSAIKGHEYTEVDSEVASFQISYLLRIVAANVSPEGILSGHSIFREKELDAVRRCLQEFVL